MSVQIAPISTSLPTFLSSKNYSKVLVLVDEQTNKYCLPKIQSLLPSQFVKVLIKSGESQKNLDTCIKIWDVMTRHNLDRHALMINLGGGVIGDMGGFCASTYKRGIDFIQVPTTLLAQVDASVGGKLGIDFQGLKNHLGVFQLPKAVLIDPAFIDTLSEKEKRSGFAEVIKHCMIRDVEKWNEVRLIDWQDNNFSSLVAHSVAIKQAVVEEDPKEAGIRKILNWGHTLGHAVETFLLNQGKRKILHGEAVAVGMITEAFIAHQRDLISLEELEEIEVYLFATYGKVHIDESEIGEIIALTLQDKKNLGGEVRFSLLTGIGDCGYDIPVSKAEMKKALQYYIG
ncbi:3-dehydroquinate synthase [Aquirufa rosea]|uniref:3-dehydroquinate synthase n=1 Tax=Aquirufa rosea TaxID=2509241 RepID=A0A4Q1BXT2_9BACT|nr:3-dehydroquinate synthase [Aquirufa rosea]RXK47157.1 3-dehydroquinate synthase [Aquirufa rosea]